MAIADAPKSRSLGVAILHVFALVGIAVAQPIYSTLAGGPEFFVANNAGALQIATIVLVLSVGLPLAIAVVEIVLRFISSRLQRSVHLAVVWIFLALLALQVINRYPAQSAVVPISLAVVAATICTVIYARFLFAERLLTLLSIGALLFPLNFMLVSPASKFFLPGHASTTSTADASKAKTPVVLIIFDEFNPTALLDKDGKIDAVRYPNFARLAANSWWYPKATSTHPQTQFAVPAILTGMVPDPKKDAPSFRDHPNNLFTMLGGRYSLNVAESITSLCPNTLCSDKAKTFKLYSFFSDIVIVYGHAVVPSPLSDRLLPSLENSWNNFGSTRSAPTGNAEAELIEAFKTLSDNSRRSRFSQFIESLDGSDRTLNFLHILLPHRPYQFYPDGTYYQQANDFGLIEGTWSSDQHLIDFAYERYLMQVGYIDHMIGKLIDRLKSVDAYDKSLIIITADHGREFKVNTSDRALDRKNIDLLHVPLFIKLPHQKTGEVDKKFVSNIDIVPTIADVLGVNLDWQFDGQSVFSPNHKETKDLKVFFRSDHFDLDRNTVVSLPLLKWQTETFGSGAPLSALAIKGPYSNLMGKSVDDLDIAGDSGAQTTRLTQNFALLENVDPESDFRPWLVSSGVANIEKGSQPWIALALNNKIVAVTQVYEDESGENRILALFPPGSIVPGKNSLAAFQVVETGTTPKFRPISTGFDTYKLVHRDAGDVVVASKGNEYPIVKSKPFGSIDHASVDGSVIQLAGWSAEVSRLEPAEFVVVFVDGKFVCAIDPDVDRPDVAEHFKSAEMRKSGFSTGCPFSGSAQQLDALRVIGIAPSGAAGELHFSND